MAIIEFIGNNMTSITLLIFASLLGMEVINNVPTLLHTPLMSGANAISGVTVVGGIYLVRIAAADDYVSIFLGVIAIFFGMINVVGGFAVTNRMLDKFKKSKKDGK
ncbi:NAD(P) transhydrogenase subunit alpha [Candidatus Haliotispira prima]|uniref:proton-translocating NAD(P)(+) transhydrogenase n=1 Tax=Candidatus Haliotispira prima TaxID=3034016 RepID=A0ABY8ME24_9SPIO|nr:NAD(P) transhydrogenase subunit alpha [Candidatus Haliotispira prima]